MNINVTKTKEMIVGVNVNPPPQLVYSDETIERVLCYKLLEVLIDTNLKWDNHIDLSTTGKLLTWTVPDDDDD